MASVVYCMTGGITGWHCWVVWLDGMVLAGWHGISGIAMV